MHFMHFLSHVLLTFMGLQWPLPATTDLCTPFIECIIMPPAPMSVPSRTCNDDCPLPIAIVYNLPANTTVKNLARPLVSPSSAFVSLESKLTAFVDGAIARPSAHPAPSSASAISSPVAQVTSELDLLSRVASHDNGSHELLLNTAVSEVSFMSASLVRSHFGVAIDYPYDVCSLLPPNVYVTIVRSLEYLHDIQSDGSTVLAGIKASLACALAHGFEAIKRGLPSFDKPHQTFRLRDFYHALAQFPSMWLATPTGRASLWSLVPKKARKGLRNLASTHYQYLTTVFDWCCTMLPIVGSWLLDLAPIEVQLSVRQFQHEVEACRRTLFTSRQNEVTSWLIVAFLGAMLVCESLGVFSHKAALAFRNTGLPHLHILACYLGSLIQEHAPPELVWAWVCTAAINIGHKAKIELASGLSRLCRWAWPLLCRLPGLLLACLVTFCRFINRKRLELRNWKPASLRRPEEPVSGPVIHVYNQNVFIPSGQDYDCPVMMARERTREIRAERQQKQDEKRRKALEEWKRQDEEVKRKVDSGEIAIDPIEVLYHSDRFAPGHSHKVKKARRMMKNIRGELLEKYRIPSPKETYRLKWPLVSFLPVTSEPAQDDALTAVDDYEPPPISTHAEDFGGRPADEDHSRSTATTTNVENNLYTPATLHPTTLRQPAPQNHLAPPVKSALAAPAPPQLLLDDQQQLELLRETLVSKIRESFSHSVHGFAVQQVLPSEQILEMAPQFRWQGFKQPLAEAAAIVAAIQRVRGVGPDDFVESFEVAVLWQYHKEIGRFNMTGNGLIHLVLPERPQPVFQPTLMSTPAPAALPGPGLTQPMSSLSANNPFAHLAQPSGLAGALSANPISQPAQTLPSAPFTFPSLSASQPPPEQSATNISTQFTKPSKPVLTSSLQLAAQPAHANTHAPAAVPAPFIIPPPFTIPVIKDTQPQAVPNASNPFAQFSQAQNTATTGASNQVASASQAPASSILHDTVSAAQPVGPPSHRSQRSGPLKVALRPLEPHRKDLMNDGQYMIFLEMFRICHENGPSMRDRALAVVKEFWPEYQIDESTIPSFKHLPRLSYTESARFIRQMQALAGEVRVDARNATAVGTPAIQSSRPNPTIAPLPPQAQAAPKPSGQMSSGFTAAPASTRNTFSFTQFMTQDPGANNHGNSPRSPMASLGQSMTRAGPSAASTAAAPSSSPSSLSHYSPPNPLPIPNNPIEEKILGEIANCYFTCKEPQRRKFMKLLLGAWDQSLTAPTTIAWHELRLSKDRGMFLLPHIKRLDKEARAAA